MPSKIAGALLLAGSAGCIAYVRPVGAWSEPVELLLDQSSLTGVRLKIDCALADDDGQRTPQDDEECMKLRVTLGNTGARILLDEIPAEAQIAAPAVDAAMSPAEKVKAERALRDRAAKREKYPLVIGDAKTEKPDFKVTYTAFESASDHCGKSILLFLFTFGFGPCVEDIDAKAEITVTDTAKGAQITRPLATKIRRYLGVPALYLLCLDLSRPVNRKDFRRLAGEHLLQYLQNVVYSFAVRDRLAAERPPAVAAEGGAP